MKELKLYYFDSCPFCKKVLRKIQELQITVELKNTDLDVENAKYHYSHTGRRTVPCLYIDDVPMFESSDICDWLEANAEKIKKG